MLSFLRQKSQAQQKCILPLCSIVIIVAILLDLIGNIFLLDTVKLI